MRKCLILILILALLCPASAWAAEQPRYLALIFHGCPRNAEALLSGLEARSARCTFFLRQEDASERLPDTGHELGILTAAGPELSRRQIAGELKSREQAMNTHVRLLQATAGCTNGLRQVAKALGFSFVIPSGNLQVLSPAEDGQILLVDNQMPVISLLELVDDLQNRGFILVTVSELARLRGVSLHPGATYRSFPPPER